MLEIRLLGQFDVKINGQPVEIPSRPAQSLLSYLALTLGVAHRRERLAGLLWPDSADGNARGYLRQTLWRLRRALETGGATHFAADDLTIALDPAATVWLDVAELSRDVSSATPTDTLLRAVSAYAGELLPGFHDEWLSSERERLETVFEARINLLLDRLMTERRWPQVLEWAERWVALGHAPEPAYRALMTAHRAQGDVSSMAAAYQRCAEALQRELGVAPSEATQALYETLSKQTSVPDRPPTSTASIERKLSITAPSSTALPHPLTRFIGRELEVREVKRLLTQSRLVTLTGSGGAGKTRLALQASEQLRETFPHGIWFVELATLTDADLMSRTVAAELGVTEEANRPTITLLANALQTKHGLLVLDNCEHVINAAAQLSESLLQACPQLHVLTTSREALGVAGEAIFQVPSLSVPSATASLSVEALQTHEAVQLFVDRAAIAVPDFVLNMQNAPAVAEICRRLDGIPLAIELAAARVKMLPPEQIAERLNDRFHLLTGGSRTVLPRQQTLRATMDWSYNLLTESERVVLRRLAAFVGGWTLEAAETVCADLGGQIEKHDILDLLTQLLNKSLIIAEHDGDARYYMLETIRRYGMEKLADSGEAHQVRARHLAYALAFAEQAEPHLTGPLQAAWFCRLDTDLDNFRMAMEWALAQDPVSGIKLATALNVFWDAYDYVNEGSHWLGKFVDRIEVHNHPLLKARALAIQSMLLVTNHLPAAYTNAQISLHLFQAAADRSGEALALLALGVIQALHGDFVTARPLLDESLKLYETLGDKIGQSNVLSWLTLDRRSEAKEHCGFIERSLELSRQMGHTLGILGGLVGLAQQCYWMGDFKRAESLLAEASQVLDEVDSKSTRAWMMEMRGNMAMRDGRLDEAVAYYEQSITINVEAGQRVNGLWAQCNLAGIAIMQGDTARGREMLTACLHRFDEAKIENGVVYSIEVFANLAIKEDQLTRAATLLAWADAHRARIGDKRPAVEQLVNDQAMTHLRAHLTQLQLAAADEAGQAMNLEQAMAFALEATGQ